MARILSGICLLLRNPKGLLQSPRPIHGPTVSVRGLFWWPWCKDLGVGVIHMPMHVARNGPYSGVSGWPSCCGKHINFSINPQLTGLQSHIMSPFAARRYFVSTSCRTVMISLYRFFKNRLLYRVSSFAIYFDKTQSTRLQSYMCDIFGYGIVLLFISRGYVGLRWEV